MSYDLALGAPFDVAIIGTGASGTLVAAQFERLAPIQARLVLIGAQAKPARGLAYDTLYLSNLLNVPAGNMSAFPDDMQHFTRWLRKHHPGSSSETYAPRALYGNYLLNIFIKLHKYSYKIDYLNNKAIELTRQDDLWHIELENGNIVTARSVVLALGNSLPLEDPVDFQSVKPYYWRNPWSVGATQGLAVNAPVLLIGTGLTMVDVALSLREAGHRGVMHAISRHGRLHQTHGSYESRSLKELPRDFATPVGALRWIRAEIEKEEEIGNNWRAVIDSLRPHVATIWRQWNFPQRRSFLRHARNIWDIHRHRMAPEVSEQLYRLIENQELIIHSGQLISTQADVNQATILWKDRRTSQAKMLNVTRIINCTGPSRDVTRTRSALVSKLLRAGWIAADPLKLGIKTDEAGRVFDKRGNSSPGLYTLGPLRMGESWETIAIPEIRIQAVELTKLLIKEQEDAKLRTYEHTH